MKRRVLLLVVFVFLLPLYGMAEQFSGLSLSASEIAGMRALIGTAPSDTVTSVSASSTAHQAHAWLYETRKTITVDDRITLYQRMLQDAGSERDAELDQLDTRLCNDVLHPIEYYLTRLNNEIQRLSSLLDFLTEEASLNEVTRSSYVTECRFLQDQIKTDIRGVAELSGTYADDVRDVERCLSALDGTNGSENLLGGKLVQGIQRKNGSAQSYPAHTISRSRSIRNAEMSALGGNVHGLTATLTDTQKTANLTVIDETQFAIVLTTGADPEDVLSGVSITAKNSDTGSGSHSQTSVTDEDGAAVFDVANFVFENKKAKLDITVSAEGYREVHYVAQLICSGSAITIPMAKDDGSVYLREASFKGDEMLHDQSNGIYHIPNSRNKFPVSFEVVNLKPGATGSLYLQVKDPNVETKDWVRVQVASNFTADSSGKAVLSNEDYYQNKLQVKEKGVEVPLDVVIELSDNTIISLPLAFHVEKALFEDPITLDSSLPSLVPGSLHFPIGSFPPVFENLSYDVGSPLLPRISATMGIDGTVIFSVGDSHQYSNDVKIDEKTKAAVDVTRRDISEQFSKMANKGQDVLDSSGRKVLKYEPAKGMKWDWYAGAGFIGQAKWQKMVMQKGPLDVEGAVWISAGVSGVYSYTQQLILATPIGPLPVYVGFDVGLSMSAGIEAGVSCLLYLDGYELKDYQLQPKVQFVVNIIPKGGVSAGVGFAGLASLGLRAYFTLNNSFIFQPSLETGETRNIYYQLSIGLGLDVELKLLLVNFNLHLLSHSFKVPESGPVPFIPDDNASLGLHSVSSSVASGSRSADRSPNLTDPPEGSQIIRLMPDRSNSVLRSGSSTGIQPTKEVLYNGNFDVTKLKTITIPRGNSSVDLIFFAGNGNTSGLSSGYSDIMYAISKDDSLEIHCALNAKEREPDVLNGLRSSLEEAQSEESDVVSNTIQVQSSFFLDFDVCYESESGWIYLLAITGLADKNGNIVTTSIYTCACTLNASNELCLALDRYINEGGRVTSETVFYGLNENGAMAKVLFKNPVINPSTSPSKGTRNGFGIAFTVFGQDLSDKDMRQQPLGHQPGTYLYFGFLNLDYQVVVGFPDAHAIYRYNDLMLDDEDILKSIFIAGQKDQEHAASMIKKSTQSFRYECMTALLTAIHENDPDTGDELPMSNRIRYMYLLVEDSQAKQTGYTVGNKEVETKIVNNVHVSNIMPGFVEGQILAVKQMTDSEPTEDGGMETTLSSYDFFWTDDRKDVKFTETNFGFTTSMNWFGKASMAGAEYLYWTQDFDAPEDSSNDETVDVKPRRLIRACMYDRYNNCFTKPFDLVELGLNLSPMTASLSTNPANPTNGHGLYMVESPETRNDEKAATATWSFADIEYELQPCLDLIGFGSTTNCAIAGKAHEMLIRVHNTGNTLVSSFDIALTGTNGEDLGSVHIDTVNSSNCSVQLYDPSQSSRNSPSVVFSGGPESVHRLTGNLSNNGERLTLTSFNPETNTVSVKNVASIGLVPDAYANYTISVNIPASWKGKNSVTGTLQNVTAPTVSYTVSYTTETVNQEETLRNGTVTFDSREDQFTFNRYFVADTDSVVFTEAESVSSISSLLYSPANAVSTTERETVFAVLPPEIREAATHGENRLNAPSTLTVTKQVFSQEGNRSADPAETLDFDQDNLSLQMKPLRFEDGTYLEITLTNTSDSRNAFRSDTPRLLMSRQADVSNSSDTPPTLVMTATLPDGSEVETFRHTFTSSIHAQNGYSLLVPLDLVDGNQIYSELTGTIIGGGVNYKEFNFYNNQDSIRGRGRMVTILTEGNGQAAVAAGNGSGASVIYANIGDVIHLTATPEEGWDFIGFTSDNVTPTTDNTFTMPGVDVTITAVFGPSFAILSGPEDAFIHEGETAVFTVNAVGAGLTYQWYRSRGNGWELIEGATGATYVTGQMGLSDNGTLFRCEVTDKYGRRLVSRTAALHVEQNPLLPGTGDHLPPVRLLIKLLLVSIVLLVSLHRKQQY